MLSDFRWNLLLLKGQRCVVHVQSAKGICLGYGTPQEAALFKKAECRGASTTYSIRHYQISNNLIQSGKIN